MKVWATGVEAVETVSDAERTVMALPATVEDGTMVDVGAGVMDWPVLLGAARSAGVTHFFAEHDEAKDQLAFARASAAYMQTLRY